MFIDELQDLDESLLRALLVTQHQAGQRGWHFYLIGAGLPHLPGILADVRSYAERLFDYRSIAPLPETESAAALVEPARTADVTFEPAALGLLVEASGGYPYFLQEYGRAVWDVAPGPVIAWGDAQAGLVVGLQRMDDGFFRSRWDRATKSERRMLVAMAEDGEGPSTSSEIAHRMGLKPTSLGPYRANLINKGLVYAPDHGLVAYTVPGMSDYVHRHQDDLDAAGR